MSSLSPPIQLLIFDIGGVLMTNGWGRSSRQAAADRFHLDFEEMEGRHALYFPLHELGIFTLDEYLDHVIFDQPRNFTKQTFIDFMQQESKVYPEMIHWAQEIKTQLKVPLVLLSNEGKELGEYRIQHFGLKSIADIFIISGAVGLRKPDPAIYRLAFHLAQVRPEDVLYLDDRLALVEAARELGVHAIQHKTLEETKQAVEAIINSTKY